MRERTVAIFVVLTFVGMVGIYVGAYLAYQKYQQYTTSTSSGATAVSGLLSLLGSKTP
jgi:hypothetical protein